ncbi:MAG TPA: twin-arginine translocation signal domain-containing protein [Planctomycetota bacterium]|nr:twin-arginine translocation signal domain-containing protein [Planctomycetota bacterium]
MSRSMGATCCGCPLSRRQFLGGCAAGVAGLTAMRAGAAEAPAAAGKAKVRLVFTYVPSDKPIWPNIGYDFGKRKKEILDKLVPGCPNLELLPVDVMNGKQARELLEKDKDQGIDGYLVFMLGLWTGAPQAIAGARKPTLFVDDLYGGSGEFLGANAGAQRAKLPVEWVSSSRLDDVVASANCFALLKQGKSVSDFLAAAKAARQKNTAPMGDMACKEDKVQATDVAECLKKLKETTFLTVGGGWGMPGSGKAIEAALGVKVVPIGFKELHAAYEAADKDEAAKWADKWMKAAEKIIEPKPDEIQRSGAMYLAMLDVMKKHNARGITINCLGGFYGGHIKAYPCLGFTQLNDDLLVGACEADIMSTLTMTVFSTLVGRPGFISDPVIDMSKNQCVYAHCVAPTKVFGPQGPANPAHIRSHSEDRKGACYRSLLPLGYMTTTLEVNCGSKQILFHQAKSVDNIDEDKACRTKLAGEVKGSLEKLVNGWGWGWHRVTFYGDLRPQVEEFAKATGMKIVEEA